MDSEVEGGRQRSQVIASIPSNNDNDNDINKITMSDVCDAQ